MMQKKSSPLAYGLAPLAGGILVLAVVSPVHATTDVPVATGDLEATSTSATVSTLSSGGSGSLRAAIKSANQAASATTITFSVAGTVRLTKKLPEVTKPVTIDGTSAPEYVAGGAPVVQVDANGNEGLVLLKGAKGSTITALALVGAEHHGLSLQSNKTTISDSYIGVRMSGEADGNGKAGIHITSNSNSIGINPAGDSGVMSNLISGNSGSGIVIAGGSNNTVVANRIGTNATGTSKLANRGHGITLKKEAAENTIGGNAYTDTATGQVNDPTGDKGKVTPVFVVPPLGNLVSGNRGDGVHLTSGARKNVLSGNFIGTTANGNSALGNRGDGVQMVAAPRNKLIGCTFVENPFVYYNVLSGNGGHGLVITDSHNVTVHANFFGVGANNTALLPNQGNGILVEGSSRNTQVGGVIPLGNVSAGNKANGIEVKDKVTGFITFNTFGGLLAFKGAAPNGRNGLLITSTGGDNLARTNVMSGNAGNGIRIAGRARGVTVDPNIVGATTDGQSPLPNGKHGVVLAGRAHNNVIGGTRESVIPQNLFSGNLGYGLVLQGDVHNNLIQETFIGTEVFGEKALPNQKGGILVTDDANNNFVGLRTKNPANIISGNIGNGVTLTERTRDNVFDNNYIGLDRTGRDLPNSGQPVSDSGTANVFLGP
ncbi:MAG: right-handed parallel beta-helix repeat-containing protein [Actinomycetia bacterium]|nr:right-handed parallel beta-helix repeat-containing protein [Actinomycetes bacterium]MCH9800295.1 right-handed parallel beta-helix repeat-containing protein [Actinomycetes bacterium]